jgi:hypothetical protein
MRKLPNRPSFTVTERLVGFVLCGVFALILWGFAFWIWNVFMYWFVLRTDTRWDWTIVLTVLALPIPFWAYQAMFSPDRRPAHPTAAVPAAAPAAGVRHERLPGLGWLYWLGNGELHRGTLVLLVVFFWSLFFWNWPTVIMLVREGSLVFVFSFWGLLTIFGMVIIRSIFSRLPGPEVPGAGDSKSKPK